MTLDKDYGELAVVYRKPHSGIIRLVDIPTRQQAMTAHRIMVRHGSALKRGALVTADATKIRLREPEPGDSAGSGTPSVHEPASVYRTPKRAAKGRKETAKSGKKRR